MRLSGSRWFRGLCWAVVLGVSAACLGSAIRDDRIESDYQHQLNEVVHRGRAAGLVGRALNQLHYLYFLEVSRASESNRGIYSPFDLQAITDLLSRGPRTGETPKPDPDLINRSPAQMAGVLDELDHIAGTPWGDQVAADIARLRILARSSVATPPTFDQVYEFVVCWRSAAKAVAADLAQVNARFVELEAARKNGR